MRGGRKNLLGLHLGDQNRGLTLLRGKKVSKEKEREHLKRSKAGAANGEQSVVIGVYQKRKEYKGSGIPRRSKEVQISKKTQEREE